MHFEHNDKNHDELTKVFENLEHLECVKNFS